MGRKLEKNEKCGDKEGARDNIHTKSRITESNELVGPCGRNRTSKKVLVSRT